MTDTRRGRRWSARAIRAVAVLLALVCLGCAAERRSPAAEPEAPRTGGSRPDATAGSPRASEPATAAASAPPASGAPGWSSPAYRPTGPRHSEPGDVAPEPATLHALAVRWPVKGDANANATVRAQYRPIGDAAWREAWPLIRTDPTHVSPDNRVADGWLFAGSIVDLTADSEYEVRLALDDPDGGSAERTLAMRTRAEPREPPGMRVRHVVPGEGGGTGSATDPFRGLRAAQEAAAPGDLFLLGGGVYGGPWTVDRHGAPGRPIIYRGGGAEPAVVDGHGGDVAVSAPGIRHVWFEGMAFRNAQYLFMAHRATHLVVRRSAFEVTRVGLTAINGRYGESQGFFIADNVFRGPQAWPRRRGGRRIDIIGVHITGAGHVVAHNAFLALGDGVHGTSHGRLSASDFHDNDFDVCTDDAIEADYSDTNVRVFRNRITNCFAAVSAQPVHGGPLYVFRNAIHNVEYSPVKLHNHTAGVLVFHNTSVAARVALLIDPAGETVSDVVTRNNLFVGAAGPGLRSTGVMIRCDFDGDGYAWGRGPFAQWNRRTYVTPEAAMRSRELYRDRGAVRMDLRALFAAGPPALADFRERQPVERNAPALAPGSPAVDAGAALPNFSEGYRGRAPDLGCCELGQPLPHYGPRPPVAR